MKISKISSDNFNGNFSWNNSGENEERKTDSKFILIGEKKKETSTGWKV